MSVALEELNEHDTRDDVLPKIDRKRSVAFTKTGVVREWSPSRRSTLTHVPGPWREERLRRMSSRDWQDGYEALEHPAEACTDTHEFCVVVVHTAVRNKRTDIIGSSLSVPGAVHRVCVIADGLHHRYRNLGLGTR